MARVKHIQRKKPRQRTTVRPHSYGQIVVPNTQHKTSSGRQGIQNSAQTPDRNEKPLLLVALDFGTQNVSEAYCAFTPEAACTSKETIESIQTMIFPPRESSAPAQIGVRHDGSVVYGDDVEVERRNGQFDESRCFDNLKLAILDDDDEKTKLLRQQHLDKIQALMPKLYCKKSSTIDDHLIDINENDAEVTDSVGIASLFLTAVSEYNEQYLKSRLPGMDSYHRETGIALPALTKPEIVDRIVKIADNAGFANIHIVSEPAAAAFCLICKAQNQKVNSMIYSEHEYSSFMAYLSTHALLMSDVGAGTAVGLKLYILGGQTLS